MIDQFIRSTTCAIVMLACTASLDARAEDSEQQNKQNKKAEPEIVLEYSSVFDDYIAFDDYLELSWKEANDLVGEFGGWREYARLVQEEARKHAEQKAQDDGGKKQ